MNTNKASVVKQSGNDVEGYLSQKVLFQPNVRVFLQYSVMKTGFYLGFFVGGGGGGGGESILKEFLEPSRDEKNFFRPSTGSEGMLPRKILKRYC